MRMQLVSSLQRLIHPFIESVDTSVTSLENGHTNPLAEQHSPTELSSILNLELPQNGVGKEGFLKIVETILKYSVNTWNRGFMDKLYGSTNAVRNPNQTYAPYLISY
jgi:glutamate decarboxylase